MKKHLNKTIAIILSVVLLCSASINSLARNSVEDINLNETKTYTFDWENDDFQHWYKFTVPITGTYTATTFTDNEKVRDDSGAISVEILNESEKTIASGLWSDLSLKATAKAKLTKGKIYYIYIEFWQDQKIQMSTNIELSSLNLLTPKISKITSGKKQFKVSWKKVKNISGYQIQYATNSKFTKGKKTITIKGNKKTNRTIKKLKAKKKYYVRIRTYKLFNNKKYYSTWSKSKTVTTKK